MVELRPMAEAPLDRQILAYDPERERAYTAGWVIAFWGPSVFPEYPESYPEGWYADDTEHEKLSPVGFLLVIPEGEPVVAKG